ncbi:MAG TPA: glycosyltransferase family 39 protein [Planctomycetota bacterium]|nr:glycosyltransferase family 39 protein [Planctomycetota bacterium]
MEDNAQAGQPIGDAQAATARRRRRVVHHVLLVLALALLVRLPLTRFPMGSSAGTVAYVGQRWLEGAVPYRDAWDHRPPGLYLLSGLVVRRLAPLGAAAEQGLIRLLLGPSARVVRITPGEAMPETCRLAMWLIDLATVLLVYRLVRLWTGHVEAVVAAGICGFFSGAFLVQGDCLGAGPPVSCLAVLAILAALRSEGRRPRWLALSGLACGLAACFDLTALLYALAVVLWAASSTRGADPAAKRWLLRPALVVGAALLPMAGFAAYFWARGAFGDFWRSAVVYNVLYRWFPVATRTPAYYWQVVRSLAPEQGALWLFAGGWALHAFSMGFSRHTRLVAYWGLCAVAAALVTRQLDAAYFQQTVPPLAIGAALAATNPSERFITRDARGRLETRSLLLVLLAAGMAFGFLYTEWRAFRTHASRTDSRADRVAVSVANMIRDRTMAGQPIYVWGVGPQIYVLADRPAAHRLFYNRPLNVPWVVNEFFGGPEVFDDIGRALIRAEPAFFVTTEAALLSAPEHGGPLREWAEFRNKHYDLWRIEETRPYVVYLRKDRALLP